MARYIVPLTTWANTAVTVEVDDDATPEQIIEAAQMAVDPRGRDVEIGDVWEPTKIDGEPGYDYTRVDS